MIVKAYLLRDDGIPKGILDFEYDYAPKVFVEMSEDGKTPVRTYIRMESSESDGVITAKYELASMVQIGCLDAKVYHKKYIAYMRERTEKLAVEQAVKAATA